MTRSTLKGLLISTALVICSFVVQTSAFAINRLGWSAEQAAAWQQMRSQNHPLWLKLKQEADNPNIYEDDGMRDGMVYLITGDVNYARSAYDTIDFYAGRTKPGIEPGTRNETRAKFASYSTLFSWIAPGLSATDKANFRDILDHWCDLVFADNYGTRTGDSDEAVGHYFGVVIYALAIKDEDPSRSNQLLNFDPNNTINPVGGVDATGASYGTWRNAIKLFVENSEGGQWLESSQYNLFTLRLLVDYSDAVNKFYGTDKFPEVTALREDAAKALIQELTPNLNDSFQWGDVQEYHGLTMFHRFATMGTIGGLTKNPEMLYVFDTKYNGYGSTAEGHYYPYMNSTSLRRAPQGETMHFANGMGIAYHHMGWNPQDSFFASMLANHTGVDHDMHAMANFGLYRGGEWVVDYPRGYEAHTAGYYNSMMINGFSSTAEARGSIAHEAGAGYDYHVGSTGGQAVYASYYDPPPESIHEWTRSHFYLHHTDGSDSVVVFDRINSMNPIPSAGNVSSFYFSRYEDEDESAINKVGGKHQWILHVPHNAITFNGNQATWNTNYGQAMKLTTFSTSGFTKTVLDEKALKSSGALGGYTPDAELKYQIRLIPDQADGYLTMLNVLHVGSNTSTFQLTAAGGEQASGALIQTGNESTAVIFNGTQNTPPAPTPTSGNRAVHDYSRLGKLGKVRLFKNGFNMNFTIVRSTDIYIADLDPTKTWVATLNGQTIPLSVSAAGLAKVTAPTSGNVQLSVLPSGSNGAPSASIVFNISGLTVNFDASQSFDPNGDQLSYVWDFGNGLTSTQLKPACPYAVAGQYNVKLTVSDGSLSNQKILNLVVGTLANQAPILNSISDRSVVAGSNLNFSVSAIDNDSSAVAMSAVKSDNSALSTIGASFVDNGNKSGTFSWTPSAAQIGSQVIMFRANDGEFTDVDSITITVTAVPPPPPADNFPMTILAGSFSSKSASTGRATWNGDGGWMLLSNGNIAHSINFPAAGQYSVKIDALGILAGSALPRMELRLDGNLINAVDVGNSADYAPFIFNINVSSAGAHQLLIAYTNDYYGGSGADRNLHIFDIVVSSGVVQPPPPPAPVCGDGIKNGSEQCDGAAGVGANQSCSAQCTLINLPFCGDNIKNNAEQCDGSDGVGANQSCSAQCTLVNLPFCGDGIKNGVEQCDGIAGIILNQTCDALCKIVNLPYCGDGIKNGIEQCDGTAGVGANQSCSILCTLTNLPYCGDGIKNNSEQCDGTAGVGANQSCSAQCTLTNLPFCGDNIKNNSEECDGTAGVSANQSCSAQCTLTNLPFCGDGIKNGSEQCDGTAGVGANQSCSVQCILINNPTSGFSINAIDMQTKTVGGAVSDGWKLTTNGYISHTVNFPTAGKYRLRMNARAELAGSAVPQIQVRLGQAGKNTVNVGSASMTLYQFDIHVPTAGNQEVVLAYINDFANATSDRNIIIKDLLVEGATAATVVTTPVQTPFNFSIMAGSMQVKTAGVSVWDGTWNLWSNGYIAHTVNFTQSGVHKIKVMAKGELAGSAFPIMEVRVDGVVKATFDVGAINWTAYEASIDIPAGSHQVAIAFTNDYYGVGGDRNLKVQKLEITK